MSEPSETAHNVHWTDLHEVFVMRLLNALIFLVVLITVTAFQQTGFHCRLRHSLIQKLPNKNAEHRRMVMYSRSQILVRDQAHRASSPIFSTLKNAALKVMAFLKTLKPPTEAEINAPGFVYKDPITIYTTLDPNIVYMIPQVFVGILYYWSFRGIWFSMLRQREKDFEIMAAEVNRDKQYRENMFFESVKEMEEKLANPSLGKNKRAYLEAQVKDLDPLGQIRSFLAGNATRPAFKDDYDDEKSAAGERGVHSRFGKERLPEAPKDGKDNEQSGEGWEGEVQPSIYTIEPDDEKGPAGQIRTLLTKLDSFLTKGHSMQAELRNQLITKLSRNFAKLYNDEGKRSKAIAAVEKRLDDEAYWVRYANKMSL